MALMHTPENSPSFSCPDFTLPGLDGKTYSRKDFMNGHPFVVMFICNHCPYVQAIEERLIQLGHDLKKKNINVIAICSNDEENYPDDSFENLRKNYLSKKMSFFYLHDKTQVVAKAFDAVCTPDFFVFDSEQRLAYRGRLDDSWKDPSKVTRRELYEAVLLLNEGAPLKEKPKSSMGCSIKWIS